MAKTLSPIAAAIPAAGAPVTFATVKAAFSELFTLSIYDAVASTYKKETAREVIARAITGAALEWAMSGNDARLKSARAALEGKGAGQQMRKAAIAAIDGVKATGKARHLAGSDMPAIEAWIVASVGAAVLTLTPATAERKAPKTAPSAPIVTVPPIDAAGAAGAPADDADDAGGDAGAPWADDEALNVAAIIAAIQSGAFTAGDIAAIRAALDAATVPMVQVPALPDTDVPADVPADVAALADAAIGAAGMGSPKGKGARARKAKSAAKSAVAA